VIPYGRQDINQSDIDSVVDVLQADFLTQGPQVPLFEKKVSNYCGAKFGVAVNSATSALHIACLALNLTKGDWLWTSPNSFVASANCGLYCGAQVDFIDIDDKTYNISITELEKKLIKAEQESRLPKIVIPVHFAGQSCDMEKIYTLSKKYGFKIIEDASHSIGGQYLGKSIGGCQYSDISVFSFHPVKIITTAEGGLATTNSKDVAEKMRLLRSHGITKDQKLMTKQSEGGWYYQQIDLGYNYRMTELQAALGVSQMDRLDDYVTKRHTIRERYNSKLSSTDWILPYQNTKQYSACHLYVIRLPQNFAKQRLKVFTFLRSMGVGVNVHYIPIHMQPYYQNNSIQYKDLSMTEKYYNSAISIPLHPGLTKESQNKVIDYLNQSIDMIKESVE
jgi:UDP-4-amino-4,6-dideoxy-N-acetyl-beta-L-altrosamine transaminase